MQEPIRILHMIGCFEQGGSQAMVINLYKTIDRSKVQFDFIVDNPSRMELAPVVEALGAKIYVMPKLSGTNIGKVRRAWNRFFAEHSEYKILHSHVRSYASFFLPIAKKYGVKTIIHSHSSSNGSGVISVVKKILQFPLRFQADYFFSCSKEAGEWLFGKKVVASSRHFVIKNAIDTEKYRYNEVTRMEYRRNLGVGEKLVFIHVGRFHPAKNHSFLLSVFKMVHDRNPETALLLVGDGELREQIEEQIRALKLENAVRLLGNRQDVAALLQSADVFLFPSLWEGLGIVAIEAQAAGLPCLVSDRIPLAVDVSHLVKRLPIDEPYKWIEAIAAMDTSRVDVIEEIKIAGFDVRNTAEWLRSFYDVVSR